MSNEKIIKNKLKHGKVLFEKYEPQKWYVDSTDVVSFENFDTTILSWKYEYVENEKK